MIQEYNFLEMKFIHEKYIHLLIELILFLNKPLLKYNMLMKFL